MTMQSRDLEKITKDFEKYVTFYYGKRCDEMAIGCPTCQAWTIVDGMNIILDDVKEIEDDS